VSLSQAVKEIDKLGSAERGPACPEGIPRNSVFALLGLGPLRIFEMLKGAQANRLQTSAIFIIPHNHNAFHTFIF
jgi:hypothetical protein